MLLSIAVLLLLSSCSANLDLLPKEGKPVCSKDFDFDETIEEFRLPSGELQLIEGHLGRKLANEDTVSRFEIYHTNPDWVAMFVKIIEDKSGRAHFFRLNVVPGGEKRIYSLEKIDEGVFNMWSDQCEL